MIKKVASTSAKCNTCANFNRSVNLAQEFECDLLLDEEMQRELATKIENSKTKMQRLGLIHDFAQKNCSASASHGGGPLWVKLTSKQLHAKSGSVTTQTHAVRRIAKTLTIDLGGKGMTGVDGTPSPNELLKMFHNSRMICSRQCPSTFNIGDDLDLEDSNNELDRETAQLCLFQKRFCFYCGGLKQQVGPALEQHCITCGLKLFRSNTPNHPCTACCWLRALFINSTRDRVNKIQQVVATTNDDTPADAPINQAMINKAAGVDKNASQFQDLGLEPIDAGTPKTTQQAMAAREQAVLMRQAEAPDGSDDDEVAEVPSKRKNPHRDIGGRQEENSQGKTKEEEQARLSPPHGR